MLASAVESVMPRRLVCALVFATAVATTLAASLGVPALTGTPSTTTARVGTLTVLARGLDDPRGVAFAHGHLFVAEAGRGGTDCPAGAQGPVGGPLCVGRTGGLAVVFGGAAHPVMTGLISLGSFPYGMPVSSGLTGVTAGRRGVLAVYAESTVDVLSSAPNGVSLSSADNAAVRRQLGRLISVVRGRSHTLADVGDSDFRWSGRHQNLVPGQFPDANPNAITVVGSTTYLVDAASNTVGSVDRRGHVRQLAFVPNPASSDAVPTCVAAGPDGKLYIGELAPGAPLNGGKIYRFAPRTRRLSVWKTRLNAVDGCGFDHAGNFYAVEFQAHGFNLGPSGSPAGDIIQITKNGKRTVLGAGKLFYPQGFATDRNNAVYVSNWSIRAGRPSKPGGPTGQVVRLMTR
jgi:hypothetical protein